MESSFTKRFFWAISTIALNNLKSKKHENRNNKNQSSYILLIY
jgi:hypothetical protein